MSVNPLRQVLHMVGLLGSRVWQLATMILTHWLLMSWKLGRHWLQTFPDCCAQLAILKVVLFLVVLAVVVTVCPTQLNRLFNWNPAAHLLHTKLDPTARQLAGRAVQRPFWPTKKPGAHCWQIPLENWAHLGSSRWQKNWGFSVKPLLQEVHPAAVCARQLGSVHCPFSSWKPKLQVRQTPVCRL